MKILVADDEPAIGLIVTRLLQQVGHEVVTAEDGQAAWELFQREPFQMVITDLVMPGLDGLDLIRRLLRDAPSYLEAGGALFAEIGEEQGEAARALAVGCFPRAQIEIKQDLSGLDRVLVVRT